MAKEEGGAATAHTTYLVPAFTAPSVPGKQEATHPGAEAADSAAPAC